MLAPEHVSVQRKVAKLTQHALAREADVSQSLIAKIERGLVKPTYAVMKKIDTALTQHRQDHGLTAKDFMQQKPIFCSPKDTLKKIINLMAQHEFSQIPVRDGEIIGLITEKEIFTGICNGKALVSDVMKPPPPIIHSSSPEEVVFSLLDHVPLLIVQDSKHVGVITKSDIFHLYRRKRM